MTENNGVLKKLMSDNPDTIDQLDGSGVSDTDKFTTASRIVQVRYRFYSIGILLCVLLLVLWFLLPSWDIFKSKKSEIQSAKATLQSLEDRERQYQQSIGFLETVQQESSNIVSCINKSEKCEDLPEEIQNQSGLARSFLLTSIMNETKMDVDERKIIESIDSFLVKLEPLLNNVSKNGEISRISIGDKTLDGGLYAVPIQIDITFEDKSYLLSFINNVEKYIPENEDIRILYKIDSISYDIINSEEPQDTSIYLILYYYDE